MEGERNFLQESESVETSALPQLGNEKIFKIIFLPHCRSVKR